MTINFDSIISSADDVLKVLSELDIYEKYLGETIKSNHLYKCIFPDHNDNTPSLGYYQHGNHVRYKCFGCGKVGGAIDYVKDYYGCTYNEAIKHLIRDFQLDSHIIDKSSTHKRKSVIEDTKLRTQIIPTFRNFKALDFNYWNQFHIPLERCLKYKVNPCSRVYYINKLGEYKLWAEHTDVNPIYNYSVGAENKCYRPYSSKGSKWLSTTTLNDIQGLEQLPPYGDLLVITSSLKDVMVLDGFGYSAIAPGGEGNFIPDTILDYLFASFQEIVIFYDNDEPGIKYGKKLSEKIGCRYTYIPTEYKEKDISDFGKEYGVDETSSLLNSII